MMTEAPEHRLRRILRRRPGLLAIAVSGGVDSLTLMSVAARVRSAAVLAVHAVSPAVPPEASQRVRDLAQARGWALRELGSGEFEDPNYLANPVNRCYFCKSNLFHSMGETLPGATLATGTNCDDLDDFRPGLGAAREANVWQPFVEAGIDKTRIRALAKAEGLPEVAALPAQPCLASRIETGIPVRADDLAFVHRVEQALTARLGPGDHRCRITRAGVVAQTSFEHALLASDESRQALEAEMRGLCEAEGRGFSALKPYQKGSAFLVSAPQ